MRRGIAFTFALGLISTMGGGGGDGGTDYLYGTDGNTVNVAGERTNPGTPGQGRPDDNRAGGPPVEPPRFRAPLDRCEITTTYLRLCEREEEETQEAVTVPETPSVVITDLAQFSPDAVTPIAEPDNVGIVGMPTNFVAAASVQTRTGTLLGFPLTVRFTPSGYDFHYGDGSSASTTTGGQMWASLGQAQFTPTPTSHTYQERGTYAADVDVRYTAEVDFGAGWIPVDGELTTDGPAQEIRIFEAHTALVAYTCEQRPSSPGC